MDIKTRIVAGLVDPPRDDTLPLTLTSVSIAINPWYPVNALTNAQRKLARFPCRCLVNSLSHSLFGEINVLEIHKTQNIHN